jgi:hypothetical protein
MFRVHKIEGDGNCLYRSLAESPLTKSKIPDDVKCKHQFIRLQMQEFAKRNPVFTKYIWNNIGNSPQSTDPKLLQDAYEQWLETLSMNKIWSGPAEYIIFAYCFEIHVVCLRQLVDRVDVFSTHQFYRNCKVRITKLHNTMFGEIPTSVANVIFIWHHRLNQPQEPIDNVNVCGNHYSYLEWEDTFCPSNIPSDTFFLRHVERDISKEVLDVDNLYPDKQTYVDSNEERLVVEDNKKNALKGVPPSDATVNKHLEAVSRTETQHTSCKRTAETPKVRRNKKTKATLC